MDLDLILPASERLKYRGLPMILGIVEVESGKFVYLSDGFTRLTGYSTRTWVGRSYHNLVAPDDIIRINKANGHKPGIGYHYRWVHKDGTILNMCWYVIVNKSSGHCYFNGVLLGKERKQVVKRHEQSPVRQLSARS